MSQALPPPEWLAQLDELLSTLQEGHTADSEDQLAARLGMLDPDLLTFLVSKVAEQRTAEAAGFLELVTAQPSLSDEVRAQAQANLAALTEQGIVPAPPGAERFVAGYIQRSRERGEQIMLLGWRLPAGRIEALVYLLDWRGDGLKDFYVTRHLSDEEWRQLVEHNANKGAALAEITLADARRLLEAAIAEGQRFSRPLPREYKLSRSLHERRILLTDLPPAAPRTYIAADISPKAVVSAYIAALHYRDFALAAELLASDHPLRSGHSLDESAAAIRAEQKPATRREESARITSQDAGDEAAQALVIAESEEVAVEKTGKRLRLPVRERFTLVRHDGGWRVRSIERVES